MSEGYDRTKDNVIFKEAVKTEKRYLNVEVFSYDGGEKKIRIRPVSKNTRPDAVGTKKEWINGKALSGITKEEIGALIIALEKAQTKL